MSTEWRPTGRAHFSNDGQLCGTLGGLHKRRGKYEVDRMSDGIDIVNSDFGLRTGLGVGEKAYGWVGATSSRFFCFHLHSKGIIGPANTGSRAEFIDNPAA